MDGVVDTEDVIPYAVAHELIFDWNGNAPAADIRGTPIDVADETVPVEKLSLSTDESTVWSPSAPPPTYASVELLVADEPYLELVRVAGIIDHVSFSESASIAFRTPNLCPQKTYPELVPITADVSHFSEDIDGAADTDSVANENLCTICPPTPVQRPQIRYQYPRFEKEEYLFLYLFSNELKNTETDSVENDIFSV